MGGGQPQPYIHSPSNYQIFGSNFSSINIGVSSSASSTPINFIEIEWSRIIEAPETVGEIALPPGKYWQEPTNGPKYMWLNSGNATINYSDQYFNGNEPGLYEFKVRDMYGNSGWSEPKHFWIGLPNFQGLVANQNLLSESSLNDVISIGDGYHLIDSTGDLITLKVNKDTKLDSKSKFINITRFAPGLDVNYVDATELDRGVELPDSDDIRLSVTSFDSNRVDQKHQQVRVTCLPKSKCENFTEGVSMGKGASLDQVVEISLPRYITNQFDNERVRILVIMDEATEDTIFQAVKQTLTSVR